jgi:glycosyltransferase involved in cell wall biosynthesis
MHICLELTAVCRPIHTGIARYARDLTLALIADNARNGNRDSLVAGYRLSRWRRRHLRLNLPGIPRVWIQEAWWPPRPAYDLVHGLDGRVPAWRGITRIATVHDLFVLHPDGHAPAKSKQRAIARYRDLASIAHRVICPSESTRRDFVERFNFPAKLVDVVPLGVGDAFAAPDPKRLARWRSEKGFERAFILFVGEFGPRKNLPRLIRAYLASDLGFRYELVCVGHGADDMREALNSLVSGGRLPASIRFPGYIPDPDLPYLYAAASAFVLPSLYEGFGLPVLEAMACGTPVVTSSLGATAEIGATHAILVDPSSEESIAAGITRAVGMTPEARRAALQYARTFTWAETARKTREVYLRASARGGA